MQKVTGKLYKGMDLRGEMGSRIIDLNCLQFQPPLPVSVTVSVLIQKGEKGTVDGQGRDRSRYAQNKCYLILPLSRAAIGCKKFS